MRGYEFTLRGFAFIVPFAYYCLVLFSVVLDHMLGVLPLRRAPGHPEGGGEFYRILFDFEALICGQVWVSISRALVGLPGTHRQHAASSTAG